MLHVLHCFLFINRFLFVITFFCLKYVRTRTHETTQSKISYENELVNWGKKRTENDIMHICAALRGTQRETHSLYI